MTHELELFPGPHCDYSIINYANRSQLYRFMGFITITCGETPCLKGHVCSEITAQNEL